MNAKQIEILRQVRATLADIADNGECDPETQGALNLARLQLGELPDATDDDDDSDESGRFWRPSRPRSWRPTATTWRPAAPT